MHMHRERCRDAEKASTGLTRSTVDSSSSGQIRKLKRQHIKGSQEVVWEAVSRASLTHWRSDALMASMQEMTQSILGRGPVEMMHLAWKISKVSFSNSHEVNERLNRAPVLVVVAGAFNQFIVTTRITLTTGCVLSSSIFPANSSVQSFQG
jgi:hypothetical protein